MGITWDDVRIILAAIDGSPGGRLELESGELRLVVRKRELAGTTADHPHRLELGDASGVSGSRGGDLTLRAPSVGIFRRASADTPSLAPAARGEAQPVLARLDVAGATRDVRAPADAVEVVRVLVEDGEFVEYGQPLMILRGRAENAGRDGPGFTPGPARVGGIGGRVGAPDDLRTGR